MKVACFQTRPFFRQRINHLIFPVILLLVFSLQSQAQNGCFNLDFADSSFVNWEGFTGLYPDPPTAQAPGFVAGRHTIMTGNGTDSLSDDVITVVAPGSTHSVRLGNSSSGRQLDRMTYTLSVDTNNSLFIYKSAVIFNDPSHLASQQPTFEVSVLDSTGAIIDSVCGFSSITIGAGVPGFVTTMVGNLTIRYRDWTVAGIDLTPYIGQDVTLEFTTRDCDLGAHFGYAYIDAACAPPEISTVNCPTSSDSITLTAPLGFQYLWSPTGDTTQTITVPDTGINITYTCTMTSQLTGCSFVLTANTDPILFNKGFTVIGCDETELVDTSTVNKGSINYWFWEGIDLNDNTLPVQNSDTNTFTLPGGQPGTKRIQLVVGDGDGCFSDTLIDTIPVYNLPVADFSMANLTQGSALPTDGTAQICITDSVQFNDLTSFVPNIGVTFDWAWNFGDLNNSTTQNPGHRYQAAGNYDVVLIPTMNSDTNCKDTISIPIEVMPLPVVQIASTDPDSCAPLTVNFTDISTTAHGSIESWLWQIGDSFFTIPNPTIELLEPEITQNVSLQVTTSLGCTNFQEFVDYLTTFPDPIANFDVQPEQSSLVNNQIRVFDQSVNAASWAWNFGDPYSERSNTSDLQNSGHVYAKEGQYEITLVVHTDLGCVDSTKRQVVLIDDFIEIPNVLTPNSDGMNDVFFFGEGYRFVENFHIVIFNRWGQNIFETDVAGAFWDGTIEGRPASEGVYFFEISFINPDGESQIDRGSVTLLR